MRAQPGQRAGPTWRQFLSAQAHAILAVDRAGDRPRRRHRRAPTLIELGGCATLTAAKILGETADVERFRSRHGPPQRHRASPGVVGQPQTASAVSDRKSPAQHRTAPHRHHPGALPPTSAGVPPTPPSQRRHQVRINPRPQTTPLRRRLQRLAGRRLLRSATTSDHCGRLTEEQRDSIPAPTTSCSRTSPRGRSSAPSYKHSCQPSRRQRTPTLPPSPGVCTTLEYPSPPVEARSSILSQPARRRPPTNPDRHLHPPRSPDSH